MKKALLTFALMLTSNMALAFGCQVFAVLSVDQMTGARFHGNAFSYTSNLLVVNDHSLAEGATTVTVTDGSSTFSASVVGRDFHTDLALLKVSRGTLQACPMMASPEVLKTKVTVVGFDQNQSAPAITSANVKTANSNKSMIPGVLNAIEIVAEGGSELHAGQSGSIITSNGKVAGMIAERTDEGTALAIPIQVVDRVAQDLSSGSEIARKYSVDRRTGDVHFNGIVIKGHQGAGVNPHEGSVNPHEGKVNPHEGAGKQHVPERIKAIQSIALIDDNVGAVLGSAEDFQQLARSQRDLANALAAEQVTQVYIAGIDGHPVHNLLELERALGQCGSCLITSFWIESANPKDLRNPTLRTMGLVSALIDELDKNPEQDKLPAVRAPLQQMNSLLAQRLATSQDGQINPLLNKQITQAWRAANAQMDRLTLSADTLDLIQSILYELQ